MIDIPSAVINGLVIVSASDLTVVDYKELWALFTAEALDFITYQEDGNYGAGLHLVEWFADLASKRHGAESAHGFFRGKERHIVYHCHS